MHLISVYLRAAAREIFGTMAGLEVTCPEGPDQPSPPLKVDGVSGGVSLTGKMNGSVYLNFTGDCAQAVAGRVLGADGGLPDDEVKAVVGEFTNMVTGNLKSKMSDKGFNCQLSIPTVISGREISVETLQSDLNLYSQFDIPETGTRFEIFTFAKFDASCTPEQIAALEQSE